MMHYIGIDVSKHKLDCCWLRDAQTNKIKSKVFKNNNEGYQALMQWILTQTRAMPEELHLVLEATGIYHESLAYALHKNGINVSVINPARPKEFANSLGNTHKTDKKDSFVLALFGYKMQPTFWQPDPKEVRELKALTARLEALETDLRRELNRLEKSSFNGASATVVDSIQHMVTHLKAEIKQLEKTIDDHIDDHPQLKKDRALMNSIPGVGPVVSRVMLQVIHGGDFSKAGQVAAYLGLIPKIQQSGQWKGRSRITKQGSPKVRAKLYMAAVTSISCNPDLQAHYQRLVGRGKCKMQAIIAVMRKLVQICFGVVKHQSEFQPQC